MNDDFGIVSARAASRAKYDRHRWIAPQDRVYATPLPNDTLAVAKAKAAKIEAENKTLIAEIAELKATNSALLAQIGTQPVAARISIFAVQDAFIRAYAEAGGEVDGRPYAMTDFLTQRRGRPVSWPRHVCMALVRRLCGQSYPDIGREFGMKDHTSVVAAVKRTPHHLQEDPRLMAAHNAVLAAFQVTK